MALAARLILHLQNRMGDASNCKPQDDKQFRRIEIMSRTLMTASRMMLAGGALILGASFALSAYSQTPPAGEPQGRRRRGRRSKREKPYSR